ncbi:MAG: hypothetical protein GY710_24625 [Desulfobacteraceae bacterium]|nr:hypothetical protein [Desulfobacteraceae bacterium]
MVPKRISKSNRGDKARRSFILSKPERSNSFTRRSSVFFPRFDFGLPKEKLGITISENELKLLKVLGVSAHPVKMYEKKDGSGKLYFGKDLVSPAQLDNYAAEIMYSALWRWFLGDRISASVLLIAQKGGVKGICSEGLKDFKEFKELSKRDVYKYSGLLAIVFYGYLFMEDDLHIKNYGLTTVYNPQKSKWKVVFGKIDHDYITDKWETGGRNFEKIFKIQKLKDVVKTKSIAIFQRLFEDFRFSPGTENSPILNFFHTIRSTSKTALTRSEANDFIVTIGSNPFIQKELEETIEDFKTKLKDIQFLDLEIINVFEELKKYGLQTIRANDIYKVLRKRLELLL